MSELINQRLHSQLVKLGDMMGDGLHLEPDGKWISREYRAVAKALGYEMPKRPRQNHSVQINESMGERVKSVTCATCSGELKQIRSGSMRAVCQQCGARFQLLRVAKKPKNHGGTQ